MHECPDCGQACDCDGEDTWYEFDEIEECSHVCDDECDNDDLFDEDLDA